MTSKTESFPLAVQHHGFRFQVKSERDAMQLLLTMVRDGICSVDKAMECLVFEEVKHVETSCVECGRLEKQLENELEERDRNADYADQLTYMISVLLDQEMGEHSNMNEPWENAIEAMRVAIGTKHSILDHAVTVCDKCLCACCWQGEFHCDAYKEAGIVTKTARELLKDGQPRESLEYWFKNPANGEIDRLGLESLRGALKTSCVDSGDGNAS